MTVEKRVTLFMEKATAVSAVVTEVKSPLEALDYVVNLCETKEACQLLPAGCGEPLSDGAEALCDLKQQKTIAAPGLDSELYSALEAKCQEKGFALIDSGMRQHLAGIDIGFTEVQHGIAETGTLVLESCSEEKRLATMVSEVHVALLPKSKIVDEAYDIEDYLLTAMKDTPDYHAFITGASRTADIERVLALGVHGPLELHILLLED